MVVFRDYITMNTYMTELNTLWVFHINYMQMPLALKIIQLEVLDGHWAALSQYNNIFIV